MGLFDKILDKFGSLEATRNLLRKNYRKNREKALRKGYNEYDAHQDAVTRLLVGRTMSPLCKYKVNNDEIMSEIYPFIQEKPEKTLPILIEYILYLEDGLGKRYNLITDSLDGSDINYRFLKDGIEDIIEDLFDSKEELSEDVFSEHINEIRNACDLQIPWTRFVDLAHRERIQEYLENESN